MTRDFRPVPARRMLALVQRLLGRIRRRPSRPPLAGVREPLRPRPTLPAAAVALAEPRTTVKRRIRLNKRHPNDPM
jgi:hypothetical protein